MPHTFIHMSAHVDLDRLAEALSDYGFAYLITVSDDYRIRAVEVDPTFSGGALDVGPVGEHTRANVSRRGTATLVWPPREPGGYSLIVDADAQIRADGDAADPLRLVPTRALLHRPLVPNAPEPASGHGYDCVVFTASSSTSA
jgi:hypothetical protein